MTDLVEPYTFADPDRNDVIAICDHYLAMAGLPTYSAQAENLARWQDTVGARLEAMALGTAIAETRRLRMAHGHLANAMTAAVAAFAIGDTREGMCLLDDAQRFAVQHEGLETRLPLPANVAHLAAHRVVRVGADLRRL
ncbi:hypothetical protein [Methylobacterium goesingense]|uniref:Uncharacterized protein n=1 Tax=Methylobacterium goesingense TaxID=243690 RepID=A0ABV2L1J6_9HYPH|nr:hypothetical protein [Methylobacterium goesingense]GJD72600.1 hypothetical protein CFIICLFH_0817 [Methylobacterium goesingense]